MTIVHLKARVDELEAANHTHEAAELAYAIAVLTGRHGDSDEPTGLTGEEADSVFWVDRCEELLRKHGTSTLELCASAHTTIEHVAIPAILHEGVVYRRLGVRPPVAS